MLNLVEKDDVQATRPWLTLVLVSTDADKHTVQEAGFRSVRVVKSDASVCAVVGKKAVLDPVLENFTGYVIAVRDAELRDGLAMRLDDTKCRWFDGAVIDSGPNAVREAIASASPMWTDEVCLLSDIPESAPQRTYETGFKQLDEWGFRLVRPAFMPVIGPYGPLPGSAQFHTRYGWKRLDEWTDGDEALVYDFETGSTKYDVVGRVVHDATDGFLRLRNGGTADIVACAQHRWPVVGKTGARHVLTTADLAKIGGGEHGSGYSLLRTFAAPDLPDLPIGDDELRLRVAICADGSIRHHMRTRRISICIRKDRKKARLEHLLSVTGTDYKTRNYPERPTEVYYDFDGCEDKSLCQFRNASPRQLRVVFDELQHWDGHVYDGTRLVLSTSSPEDAEFCEYLFSACGLRASVFTQNGSPERQRDNFLVCANEKGARTRCRWDEITRVPSADGKKYCLTTSTGFFVCRLAPGQVFVTGNSGKSVLIRQLACNLYRMHGWRCLITAFEEKVKPRYVRDLRAHLIGDEDVDPNGELRWTPKHPSRWTPDEVAEADGKIQEGFRFLRRKRGDSLDAVRLIDRIEYAVKVYGAEVVIIDPVNEIDHQVPKGMSKTDYMGTFMMQLKALADDYNLLMIVCAHPPKDGTQRRGGKHVYTLADGADTAHYGNKADIGWCVWRPSNDQYSPTYLNIDKLKDHDVMGRPTLAKLMLDKGMGRFVVTRVGYEEIMGEIAGGGGD